MLTGPVCAFADWAIEISLLRFACWLARSLGRSAARLLAHSFLRPLAYLTTHWLVQSLARSLDRCFFLRVVVALLVSFGFAQLVAQSIPTLALTTID